MKYIHLVSCQYFCTIHNIIQQILATLLINLRIKLIQI